MTDHLLYSRRVRDDDAWIQLLPLARITADVVMCQICGHTIETVANCNILWCEEKLNGRPHSHCESSCNCTTVGCMPQRNGS